MNAMTWWDHETRSVWSQPWGLAIRGPLEGTRLDAIAANIVPWATWLDDHPQTLFMDLGGDEVAHFKQPFGEDYVIGVTLGEHAKGYYFPAASEKGVINDLLGPFPVLVLADDATKAVHVYLRSVGDEDLEFTMQNGRLTDRQTESVWNTAKGIAVEGPLQGELLKEVPYMTAFKSAWRDFYPHSELYE